jgi:hypothetical protein
MRILCAGWDNIFRVWALGAEECFGILARVGAIPGLSIESQLPGSLAGRSNVIIYSGWVVPSEGVPELRSEPGI